MICGGTTTDAEVKTGVAFLASGPLKAYEEQKNAKDTKNTKDTKETKDTKDTKDAKKSASEDEKKAEKDELAGDSMMAGVIPGAGKKDEAKKLLPVTTRGRYVKILLSSSEFLFVD